MIRNFAIAFVGLAALLILLAEVQRLDDQVLDQLEHLQTQRAHRAYQ